MFFRVSALPCPVARRLQSAVISAMAPDDFPGRLAIAPDPLCEHRIADLRAEPELPLKALQTFIGQAVVPADTGFAGFVRHVITLPKDEEECHGPGNARITGPVPASCFRFRSRWCQYLIYIN